MQGWFLPTVLVFLRVGAAATLLPGFGEQVLPVRVKLAAALALTAVVAPAVRLHIDGSGPAGLALAMAAEAVAGLAIGFGARLFILALQIGGAIAAQATSLSQIAGGTGPEPQPAIGEVLTLAGLALAVAARLHVRVAALLILSYDVLPPGRFPAAADLSRWGLGQIASGFSLGFSLAAPFVAAALVYNLALGFLSRAMPQLMVSLVGAPALTFGALALLAIVAPPGLALWLHAFQGFITAPFASVP
ncbi:MAG: type III secretion protein [Rhodobacteraceae bacterium]|nr:type III secretion protein [Paracoccaceae bacterium]